MINNVLKFVMVLFRQSGSKSKITSKAYWFVGRLLNEAIAIFFGTNV